MEKEEEGFDKIIDPETNKAVPIESAVGQQVIKNYLTIMNGGNEDELISTKKYYKSSSSSKPSSGGGSKLSSVNESKSSRPSTSSSSRPSSSRPSTSTGSSSRPVAPASVGSIRGKCGNCGKPVYSNEPRVKVDGVYYKEACFNKIKK